MIDYELWEVIKNSATLPKTNVVECVTAEVPITTTKEKAQRRLEVKARSSLMMVIPNEHQLKFNSIKDAKKLQKLVSQMELLEEKLSKENVSQKLLRSLSPEWNTYVVAWRNKADLETISMDDLYNNLKVYELEVKRTSSSSSSTQNMTFVSSSNNNTSSTNGAVNTAQAVNTAHGVSTASTQVNAAYSTNVDNLSDVVICSFFASHLNSPQLVHEDLEQIHRDNEEEDVSQPKIKKKIVRPSIVKKEFVKSKQEEKTTRKSVKQVEQHRQNTHNPRDYEKIDGGYVAFRGNPKGEKITRKCTIKTGNLDFENVYFVKELECNLFSVSQMCDKKNRVPRQKNMYSVNLMNIVPKGGLTCLFAKATSDESKLWHIRVLVVKPHNRTPYELFHGRTPTLSFMRPFGCHVTIPNIIDHLVKFNGKADEGFFIGYSLNSKAFRVFNNRTKIVEENLHIKFIESTPNVVGSGPDWLFDIDALTRTMNYKPIVAGTQSKGFAGARASDNAGQATKEPKLVKDYILLPV
uniref:Ribonuclease H-like domain-containing protein n=1 Tax=Tanacetum cinerariifolium TaxID=118510 RepID=A0A6L2JNR0_TANCI|nr:ribonuclease H-like domain-containing protein [Tanacetum cinerariifolium]